VRFLYLMILPAALLLVLVLWYALVVGWALILRRMAQSVATWDEHGPSRRRARARRGSGSRPPRLRYTANGPAGNRAEARRAQGPGSQRSPSLKLGRFSRTV
jgi:hypothetical protein